MSRYIMETGLRGVQTGMTSTVQLLVFGLTQKNEFQVFQLFSPNQNILPSFKKIQHDN